MSIKQHWKKLTAGLGALCLVACALGVWSAIGVESATASTRLVQPISQVVPEGRLVKIDVTDANGRLTANYLVDPSSQRCVHMVPADEVAGQSRPYAAILVYESVGRSELNGTTLEVYSTDMDSYPRIEAKFDALGGQTVSITGSEMIDGVETTVVEAEQITRGSGETAKIRAYIDSSGLVVRQEIRGGGDTAVLTSRIVSPDSEKYGQLTRDSLQDLAKSLASDRLVALASLSYPIMVLPAGFEGLDLLSLVPSGDGPDYLRLDYQTDGAPGCSALAIRIWDLNVRTDYPTDKLPELAKAEEEDLGTATRVCFRLGDSAIQLMVEKHYLATSAMELAHALVPIGEAGLN